jgi:CBS domain-containing protein
MLVQDIMQQPAITCRRDDTLNRAAQLMWEHDCGALPVVDEGNCLVGMLTDRDALMAAYTQGGALRDLFVRDAMSSSVYSCRGDEPIEVAERIMGEQQVRRVPVVDEYFQPVGVLSINDLARDAARHKHHGQDREFIETLAAVCAPRLEESARSQAAE